MDILHTSLRQVLWAKLHDFTCTWPIGAQTILWKRVKRVAAKLLSARRIVEDSRPYCSWFTRVFSPNTVVLICYENRTSQIEGQQFFNQGLRLFEPSSPALVCFESNSATPWWAWPQFGKRKYGPTNRYKYEVPESRWHYANWIIMNNSYKCHTTWYNYVQIPVKVPSMKASISDYPIAIPIMVVG